MASAESRKHWCLNDPLGCGIIQSTRTQQTSVTFYAESQKTPLLAPAPPFSACGPGSHKIGPSATPPDDGTRGVSLGIMRKDDTTSRNPPDSMMPNVRSHCRCAGMARINMTVCCLAAGHYHHCAAAVKCHDTMLAVRDLVLARDMGDANSAPAQHAQVRSISQFGLDQRTCQLPAQS